MLYQFSYSLVFWLAILYYRYCESIQFKIDLEIGSNVHITSNDDDDGDNNDDDNNDDDNNDDDNKYSSSRIRGVVANYLASQARDPGSIPTSTKKIHDIYGAIWGMILCLAAICAACWFSCMVVPEPIV